MKLSLFLSIPLLATLAASAGDPVDYGKAPADPSMVDKSGYTLFNPTPRELWRDLSPDRPDATESPVTVDAGAWVVEASYLDWRRDNGDESYTVMATNLKLGLTNDTDLQFVFDSYTWENPAAGAGSEGFGDVQLRLKHNLWGNEGGSNAFAIFPFVKIPTGTPLSNGEVEGGLILPFGMDLTDGIGLGLMAEIDAVYNDVTLDHDIEFLHSAVLGIDLTDRLGMFTEYIGITGPSTYQAYFAGGFTLSLSEDLVLDWGTQVGLNDNSEDLGIFGGFTKRF
ncbi:MAG: transporter [Verrucomicrobiales bacterium]|nr:transporter [Verrucomicrobiales bacterium]